MTKDWPSFDDRCCAASRAIISVLPPAPNGTITVTGRAGQSVARNGPVCNARVARARNAATTNLKAQVTSASKCLQRGSVAYFGSAGKMNDEAVIIATCIIQSPPTEVSHEIRLRAVSATQAASLAEREAARSHDHHQ